MFISVVVSIIRVVVSVFSAVSVSFELANDEHTDIPHTAATPIIIPFLALLDIVGFTLFVSELFSKSDIKFSCSF